MAEDTATGALLLRRAFLLQPSLLAPSQSALVGIGDTEAPVIFVEKGLAYRSCALPDGRRVILDLLLPGDLAGLDHGVLGHSNTEVTAATRVDYRSITRTQLQGLLTKRAVLLRILALMTEMRWRLDRHMAICRLEARERLVAFVLGLYERLRARRLISRGSFRLPLTQGQIADHLGMTQEHANRTLREMRAQGLLIISRQVVIKMNLHRMRAIASRLPLSPDSLTIDR